MPNRRPATLFLLIPGFQMLFLIMAPAVLVGQDSDPGDVQFAKRVKEWRQIIVELQLLRQEYFLAENFDSSAELRKKYDETKEKGNRKIRELKMAACKAFRDKPRVGAEYHAFLINSLAFDLEQTEDQGIAFEMAKALATLPVSRADVARRVGMSMFINSEFDQAKKFLQQAVNANESGMEEFKLQLRLIPRFKPLWEKELEYRKADSQKKMPRAVFETTKGRFVVELFEDNAPNTVKNFVTLARKGFYNDLDFFYVLPFQFCGTGSPNSTFTGSPGYVLENEGLNPETRRGNFRGTLCAPSRDEGLANIAGSIFMITFMPYSEANTDKYCNFGRVIEGMEVVDALNRSQSAAGEPVEDFKADKILKVTVENLRDHDYKAKVIPLNQ